jgi:flagellar biosynthesis anti-sigma factor FlgM
MKIDGRPGVAAEPLAPRRQGTAERVRAAEDPGASADASRVDLSPTARRLNDLVREVGDVRSVDATRVAELRSRLAAGQFDPDDEAVAAAFLREIAED